MPRTGSRATASSGRRASIGSRTTCTTCKENRSQERRRRMHDAQNTADREIVLTRLLGAPRELVWKVWTDPGHVAAWWGPTGFTTTTQAMEVRPGGVWRYVMHGPDGRDYKNLVTFL